MWTEIATGGAFVSLLGIIIRNQYSRIAKKVDAGTCKKEHEHVTGRLQRGEEKFDKLGDTMTEMNLILARVDERVKALADKNGV